MKYGKKKKQNLHSSKKIYIQIHKQKMINVFPAHVTNTHVKILNLKLKKISALGLFIFRPALQLWLAERIPLRTQPRFPGGKPVGSNRQVVL